MTNVTYILGLIAILAILAIIASKTGLETFISPLAGPVDLLQSPKQLLMDGYRFQDSLFPPEEHNLRQVTDLCPSHRQRVGVFKDKAYVMEGFESPGAGSLIQVSARGAQDRHLLGHKGDPIAENVNLLMSSHVSYGPPETHREINYPNQIFSWGDILHRYGHHIYSDFSISSLKR